MISVSLPFRSVRLALLALLHRKGSVRILLVASLLVALAITGASRPGTVLSASAPTGDSLYVGDAADNSVKRFDAQTGQYLGAFVPPMSGSCSAPKPPGLLCGPRGMLYAGNLLVSNQNVGLSIPGEIDQYNHLDGTFLSAIPTAPFAAGSNAPWAPDGIIRGPDNRTLYVASVEDCDTCSLGRVATYDVNTGHFLRNLNFSSFIASGSNPTPGEFHPRGLIFGPNGLLYLSLRSLTDPVLGGILSYNLRTGAVSVVASYNPRATDCSTELHRPDGLTFGPNGRLYVTSFRANSSDIDRILIFNAGTGTCLDEIDLDQVGQPRAFAQYLLFGPGGSLFVPIAGNGPDTGAVRRYDVSTKTFTDFVLPSAQGGPLGSGWGLTFGQTNPDTLAYGQ